KEKYAKSSSEIVEEIISLGDKVTTADTDLIITPETSFPGREDIIFNEIQSDPNITRVRNWAANYPQAVVIAGVSMVSITNATEAPNVTSIPYTEGVWLNRFNSAIQLENSTTDIPFYHKSK